MSLTLFENKNIENHKKAKYKPSRLIQTRNPTYNQKISGVYCEYCRNNSGRKKLYRSLNSLTAHCRFDHRFDTYQEKIMLIADQILNGEIQ